MSENNSEGESESSEPTYTIQVNGNEYALNEDFRQAIQDRAYREYEENFEFSCWWRLANASDEQDDDTPHEAGDPILVIETVGPMVPWERLDMLEMEMSPQSPEAGDDSGSGADVSEHGEDTGMKMMSPEDVDDADAERSSDRTHFTMTPKSFEDVPQPDGEDEDKIPPKPVEMNDDPALVWWVPRHPDMEERWSAGEAVVPTHSWVEWNIQARADEIRFTDDGERKENSHGHFESLCNLHDCEKTGEYEVTKDVPRESDDVSGQVERKGEKAYEDGRYGGGHWNV